MIFICQAGIGDVMIDADRFFRSCKQLACRADPIKAADVQQDQKITGFSRFGQAADLIQIRQMAEHRAHLFQIYLRADIAVVIPQIMIYRHTGTDAVAVGIHMAGDGHTGGSRYHIVKILHHFLPQSL